MKIVLIILFLMQVSMASWTVGVNSGSQPYIGYILEPVVPYMSFSFIHTKGTFDHYLYEYRDYHPDPNKREYEEADTLTWNLGMLTTNIGATMTLGKSDLRPFLRFSAGLPVPIYMDIQANDTIAQADIDTLLSRMKDDPEPKVTLSGGAGIEYFLTEKLSIKGELNYSYTFGGTLLSYSHEEDDQGKCTNEEKHHAKFILGKTNAIIWLNFYL